MADEGNGPMAFWTAAVAIVSAAFGFTLKKWKRDDSREDRLLDRADRGPRKELRECQQREIQLTRELAQAREQVLNLREDLERQKEHEHTANVECDKQGIITDWDETATRMFGWSRQQAIGNNVELIVPRSKRGQHSKAFGESVAGHGKVTPDGASRVLIDKALTKQGNEIDVKITLTSYMRDGDVRFQAKVVHFMQAT